MKACSAIAALVSCPVFTAAVDSEATETYTSEAAFKEKALSVSGVQKVIQMLNGMQATAKQEKNDQEVAFAKFKTWCEMEVPNTQAEIDGNAETMAQLASEIEKLGSEIHSLSNGIQKLDENIASYEADMKSSKEKRAKTRKEFEAESADYAESVDAVARALETLEAQTADRPATGASSLLQLEDVQNLPARAQSIVSAFIAMSSKGDDGDDDDLSVPEANAYENQSGDLIQMLKNLQDEFRAKLTQCEKEEMNSQHSHQMVVMDLTDSIENSNKDKQDKEAEKSRKKERSAEANKELGSESNMKATNEKSLADMKNECQEKQMSFTEQQQLRTEEIDAIGQALEILNSPEVSGNAEKYMAFVQAAGAGKKGRAFVQAMRSHNVRHEVRELLKRSGRHLQSQRLMLLAEKMVADPFAKVKAMISDMYNKLMEEANAAATHEGYCDTEMGKSKVTRNKLNQDIEGLSAAVDDGKANVMSLTQTITKLQNEVAALESAMSEATALRKEEKATNAETVKDAKASQNAVAAATAVLKDFYAKAMTATALVQQGRASITNRGFGITMTIKMGSPEWQALANPNAGAVDTGHKAGMQTFGESYGGQQDEAGGVMAMLEVIESDFANLEADTTAAEGASQKAYDDFMRESKRNKMVKTRSIEMNSSDRATAETKLREDISDMKATQDQLLAAERYHDNLVPQCVEKEPTYAEKVAAREEEMGTLKEALELLSQEDIA